MSDENRPPPAVAPGLRASDADRERLVTELNEHVVAGRLSDEEFEQRAADAYAARTAGELQALRADLPITPAQRALHHRERRSQLTRRMIQETGGSAALFVVCAAIWVASGASGQFWPVWVLIVVVLSLTRNAWALYGPGADLDSVQADLDRRRVQRLQPRSRRADGRGRHRRLDR